MQLFFSTRIVGESEYKMIQFLDRFPCAGLHAWARENRAINIVNERYNTNNDLWLYGQLDYSFSLNADSLN